MSANVANVAIACTSVPNAGGTVTDNFTRANGPLGSNWTDISDGGLAILSQVVVGTSTGVTGGMRTGEAYSSDHYSQVEVTSTQLTGYQWIGPAVRLQNGGQDGYLGIYYWNNGNPELKLYKRSGTSSWTPLGNAFDCGALAAGTQLELAAAGSTISFLENGVARITVTDASFTGGAPGIISAGTGAVSNWSGGDIASSYSIGGVATGLAGTVVLQDINGDTLSVEQQRVVYLRCPVDYGQRLQRHGRDQPCGADLRCYERIRDGCRRERRQYCDSLHDGFERW